MVSDRSNGVDGPLKGIRVLDWTMWQFGPVSTAMMGDMGADVIKIEALDGDAGRALRRASPMSMNVAGDRNAYFEACNRNKRGIAVNLRRPRAAMSSTDLSRMPTSLFRISAKVSPSVWASATTRCARSTPGWSTARLPDMGRRVRTPICHPSTAVVRRELGS